MPYTYSFMGSVFTYRHTEVFRCAKIPRIGKYLDKLALKTTSRVAESGSAEVVFHIFHEISSLCQGNYRDHCFLTLYFLHISIVHFLLTFLRVENQFKEALWPL